MRIAALLATCLIATPALAATDNTPLVNFGVGAFDVIDNLEQDKSTDLRLEYRFGEPVWYVLKPQIGLEATTDGNAAAFAGLVADWTIADNWVFSPSFSVGAYASGAGKEMGSTLQFRSQLEGGYKFDNGVRLVGAFSHISNGDLADKNPGVEVATVYLQVPGDWLLPR